MVRLGLPADLQIHLNTTNPIESALSVTRRLTRRVTRWREGNMRQRWCAAGLLQAEKKFRRLKGYLIPVAIGFQAGFLRGKETDSTEVRLNEDQFVGTVP